MADPRLPFAVPTPINVPKAPDMVPTGRFLPPDPVHINPISGQPVQPSTIGQPSMGIADFLAGLTPGVNTLYNWNRTGPWGRAANIGLDLADALTLKATGPITTPLRSMLRRIPTGSPNITAVRTGTPPGTPWGTQSAVQGNKRIEDINPLFQGDLPIPREGFTPSRNWGHTHPTIPSYDYEKGISSYQMLPFNPKTMGPDMNKSYTRSFHPLQESPMGHIRHPLEFVTGGADRINWDEVKWVARNPRDLDRYLDPSTWKGPEGLRPAAMFDEDTGEIIASADNILGGSFKGPQLDVNYGKGINPFQELADNPMATSPRYFDAERHRQGAMARGLEPARTLDNDFTSMGTFKLEGQSVPWLGADYELLMDPKAISSWGRIPASSVVYASPEYSAQLFKNFDPYGNPLPWVDRFGRNLQNFMPLPQGQSLPFTSGVRIGQVGNQYINELQR